MTSFAAAQAGSTLQSAVTRAMADQRGTVVVLDVHSGRVVASYHPEVAEQRLAFPGSSIKPITLLALLDAGKVDARTALMCKRPLSIAGHKLDCPHPATAEPLDPVSALAYSCNSYFTSVVTRLTAQQLRNAFVRAGFESVTGLGQKEAAGNVALAQSQADLQLQAIGEWGVRITPLELLRAYRSLALMSTQPAGVQSLVSEGLQGSVSYGMARAAQPDSPMKVAGKTGTAAVEEGAWTHGWFAGYAPADSPQIALVVFLEKGHGADAAAMAREIFAAYAVGARASATSNLELSSRARASQRTHQAFFWVDALAGPSRATCISPVSEEMQVLRLRARPTRNQRVGKECGRSAQDDSTNCSDEAPHYPSSSSLLRPDIGAKP